MQGEGKIRMEINSELLIHELIHLTAGVLSGGILVFLTKRWAALIWAVGISMFIDIDHLVDYFYGIGFKFDWYTIMYGTYLDESDRFFVPLHSWELAMILLVFGYKQWKKQSRVIVLALGLGMLSHLLVDQIDHQLPWQTYFLTLRIFNSFLSF